MKKMTSKLSVLLLILTLGIFGCGSSETQGGKALGGGSGNSSTTGGPEVGNLPAPQSQIAQGDTFFQNKEAYDSYSPEMKALFQKNYADSFKKLSPDDIQNSSYFVTPFGHVISLSDSTPSSETAVVEDSNKKESGFPIMYGVMMCSDFVCIEQPVDNQTVDDSLATVAINGTIDICRSANLDPVPHLNVIILHVKSNVVVYRRAFCDAEASPGCNTRPNTEDLKAKGLCTDNPPARIGTFSIPAASLKGTMTDPGPGKYKIIFDATDRTGGGSPKQLNIVREGDPQIAKDTFLSPSDSPGNIYSGASQLSAPVNDGDKVSMAYVKARVKLLTEATGGVVIKFANYEDDPQTHPNLPPRYVSFGESFSTLMGVTYKPATLNLYDGKNYFKVMAYRAGKPPPTNTTPTNTLYFSFENEEPKVTVKVLEIKDENRDVPIYEACTLGKDGQQNCPEKPKQTGSYKLPAKMIRFCYVNAPLNSSRQIPVDAQGCIKNWRTEKDPKNLEDTEDRKVTVNGRLIDNSCVIPEGDGIFKFEIVPPEVLGDATCANPATLQVGVNFFKIDGEYGAWNNATADTVKIGKSIQGSVVRSFGYGKVNPLFVNKGGLVSDSLNSQPDSFIPKAVSLQIQDKIIKNDIKQMVLNYIGKQENIESLFKNYNGSSSLNFLPGFKFEKAILNQLGVDPVKNVLTADLIIPGMVGDAEDVKGPRRCEDGLHSDVVPIRFEVQSLSIKLSIKFEVDKATGLQRLVETEGYAAIKPNGKLARGRYVWIDSRRYPTDLQNTCAALIEQRDVDGLIVEGQINSALDGTVKTLPDKFSNDQWAKDILLLAGYDLNDPFRFSTTFDFLGSQKSIDVAFDLLRATAITFYDEGIQIWNVPIRINPGQKTLTDLLSDPGFATLVNSVTSIGSYSSPFDYVAPPPRKLVNDDHNIAASLSESLLNQVLFALSEGGLLDLKIDPNFFSNPSDPQNAISFIEKFTPQVSDILTNAKNLDLNGDGVVNDEDRYHPLQLRTFTDKVFPPHLHFLTSTEKKQLIAQVKKNKKDIDLNPNLQYFRLTLSNFVVSVHEAAPVGLPKTFCSSGDNVIADGDIATRGQGAPSLILNPPKVPLPNSRAVCSQTVSIFYPLPVGATTCPKDPMGRDLVPVKVQTANGAVNETPLVKYRADLVLYGVIQGTFEEALNADSYDSMGNKKVSEGKKKFIRVRILDSISFGDDASFKNISILENNTAESNVNLLGRFRNIFDSALNPQSGQDCGALNEFRVSLNSLRFPAVGTSTNDSLVQSLGKVGVDYLDLAGSKKEEWPMVDVDWSSINFLLHLGVHWTPEKK